MSGRIWALTLDDDRPVSHDHLRQIATAETIVTFGRDPRNGDVLIANLQDGTILRLVPNPAAK